MRVDGPERDVGGVSNRQQKGPSRKANRQFTRKSRRMSRRKTNRQ